MTGGPTRATSIDAHARTTRRTRVLVVGCGGIGGVVLAALSDPDADVGAEVAGLTTNAGIAAATRTHGLRLRGVDGAHTVRGECLQALPPDGTVFDWILLATQPPQVEDAARSVVARLAADGSMVCFQNGLCEERIAAIAGRRRVVGAVVAWGAAMPEPGVYERTSAGGFTVGWLDGAADVADAHRLDDLVLLLERIGPVTRTVNLAGARWSKLAINCAISTLGTIGGARLGSLMVQRSVRRLALEIMTEAVAVARAEHVQLEKVSGTIDLDWIALTDSERRASASASLVAKHSMMLAVGARYRRLRSSMLAAIERGRVPAIDYLNGEVVARGEKFDIATPFNREAQRLVHAIARRECTPGPELLRTYAARVAE